MTSLKFKHLTSLLLLVIMSSCFAPSEDAEKELDDEEAKKAAATAAASVEDLRVKTFKESINKLDALPAQVKAMDDVAKELTEILQKVSKLVVKLAPEQKQN